MNRIAITVYVDIPDGLTPDVTYGNTPPVVAATLQTMDEPPLPDAPPDLFQEAKRIFPEAQVTAGPPTCRTHNKPMTFFPAGITKSGPNAGKPRGAFYKCSEKVGDNWCRERQDAA